MDFLIETALLTHGLSSLSNEYIRNQWPFKEANIAYLENGIIKTETIDTYLTFRKQWKELTRIDCMTLDHAKKHKLSGAFTASATMEVCRQLGISAAVTAGMGGIGTIEREELCPDLPALEKIPVILVSSGPKDMLDRAATFSWLQAHHVSVKGWNTHSHSGYVFCGEPIPIEPLNPKEPALAPLLLINEIPSSRRIADRTILDDAVAYGHAAAAKGMFFHPAANKKMDERTKGYSSEIQLTALIENAKVAHML